MKKIMFYCHVFYPQNTGYSNAFQSLICSILEYDTECTITVMTPYPLGGNQELYIERLSVVRLQPKIKIKRFQSFLNEYFYAKKVSNVFLSEKYELLVVETFDQVIFLNSLDKRLYSKTMVRVHAASETECVFFSDILEFRFRKFFIKKFLTNKIKWFLSTNAYHVGFLKKHYFDGNVIKIGNASFFVLPTAVRPLDISDLSVGKKIKVFTLGRMDYLGNNQKGFTDLIYALRLLDPEVLEKLDITVVGNGDMREYLMSLCSNIGNIHFIKSLSHEETILALKNSDVVLLASRYEGLSMFALEGLATANVCIFSKTGGLVDMIEGNGVFIEPQNIESLVNALAELTLKSDDQIVEMKKKSLEICRKKFSPEVIAKKFQAIYKLVLAE